MRLTGIFNVLQHNEEICSAAEAPLGASSSCYQHRPANKPSSPASSPGQNFEPKKEMFRENELYIASFKISKFISVPSLLIID